MGQERLNGTEHAVTLQIPYALNHEAVGCSSQLTLDPYLADRHFMPLRFERWFHAYVP